MSPDRTGAGTPLAAVAWQVLESRDLHIAEPWLRLSVQRIRLPDGRTVDEFYRIALPDYAVVVATTDDGRFVMERSYKHGPGCAIVCLPAGVLHDGEDPLAGAQRELLEETGYAAPEWRSLGSFTVNGNYGCGRAHLYRATSARKVAEPDSGDLEEIHVELMTSDQVAAAGRAGEIGLLSSAAAIALATNPFFAEGFDPLGHPRPTSDGRHSAA